MKNQQANLTFFNIYAPTENASEEEKNEFYEKIEELYEEIPKNDILILLGDFNAKIGKEDTNREIAGKETIHQNTNNNGRRICNLAAATDTFIISTQFKHKKEHKNVRSSREANADSDHILVISDMKLKILTDKNDRKKRKRRNRSKPNTDNANRKFCTKLEEKLLVLKPSNVDKTWEDIKDSILITAEETIGLMEDNKRKDWYDEECEQASKDKDKARHRQSELEFYTKLTVAFRR
ncbi:uncharacterized protein [Diabrotica undecimpunctata]|uniref:uncharacterized protein n=1 Tax=Diabrotica undecimpunctata TaxID=50387 RepID=UPI003B6328BF